MYAQVSPVTTHGYIPSITYLRKEGALGYLKKEKKTTAMGRAIFCPKYYVWY
jgi:hypothetical protein